METTCTETTIEISCTFDELSTMAYNDAVIWATPERPEVYIASAKAWRDDYIIANIDDFLQAEGWTSLGWEDMTEEEREAVADDLTTITVDRFRR